MVADLNSKGGADSCFDDGIGCLIDWGLSASELEKSRLCWPQKQGLVYRLTDDLELTPLTEAVTAMVEFGQPQSSTQVEALLQAEKSGFVALRNGQWSFAEAGDAALKVATRVAGPRRAC